MLTLVVRKGPKLRLTEQRAGASASGGEGTGRSGRGVLAAGPIARVDVASREGWGQPPIGGCGPATAAGGDGRLFRGKSQPWPTAATVPAAQWRLAGRPDEVTTYHRDRRVQRTEQKEGSTVLAGTFYTYGVAVNPTHGGPMEWTEMRTGPGPASQMYEKTWRDGAGRTLEAVSHGFSAEEHTHSWYYAGTDLLEVHKPPCGRPEGYTRQAARLPWKCRLE